MPFSIQPALVYTPHASALAQPTTTASCYGITGSTSVTPSLSQESGSSNLAFPWNLVLSSPHDRSRPMPEQRGAPQAAFLTLPRAAEYLGISPNTLYVWRRRRQGGLPASARDSA
ncbi:helix-turn-helix domain-containing protein [Streptomyces bauhiniae]|uniref:helix-turn-helix domain-containing protein n=1 Tax=Streptomyces bauhiniae TaxID=2340725 RepID=UPI003317ABA6